MRADAGVVSRGSLVGYTFRLRWSAVESLKGRRLAAAYGRGCYPAGLASLDDICPASLRVEGELGPSRWYEAVAHGLDRTRTFVAEALGLAQSISCVPREAIVIGRVIDPAAPPRGSADLIEDPANGLGLGRARIRLDIPEAMAADDVAAMACHELVHHALARLLGSDWLHDGAPPCCDWIVRAIESSGEPDIPGIRRDAPVWKHPPKSRNDELSADSGSYLGELADRLLEEQQLPPWKKQRLIECTLGRELLRRFRDQYDTMPLVAVLSAMVDAYKRYQSGAIASPFHPDQPWFLVPAGRLSEPQGLSAAVRLSIAAHAFSVADNLYRAGEVEPQRWLDRFAVSRFGVPQLHVTRAPGGLRGSAAAHLAVALRSDEGTLLELIGGAIDPAEPLEMRVLWARVASRLIDSGVAGEDLSVAGEAQPLVIADDCFEEWSAAAASLVAACGARSAALATWAPRVEAGDSTRLQLALSVRRPTVYVSAEPLSLDGLDRLRRTAATHPLSGALFPSIRGEIYERLAAAIGRPCDPRYREDVWCSGPVATGSLFNTVREATAAGRLTSPLSHLVSMMRLGFAERIV